MKVAEQFFEKMYTQIPMIKTMGARPVHYDGQCLKLELPLEPNINDKGIAFAGSLAGGATFCGYAVIKMLMNQHGFDQDLAAVSTNAQYKAPIKGAFIVTACLPGAEKTAEFLQKLREKGKASLALNTEIACDGEVAMTSNDIYVAYPRPAD